MAIKTALAPIALVMALVFHAIAFAETAAPAQLRLLVVNQQNVALPQATVTIYTLDGKPGVTVKADGNGIAVFPAVSAGMTQIVVKSSGFSPFIDKTVVRPGVNTQTVALHARES